MLHWKEAFNQRAEGDCMLRAVVFQAPLGACQIPVENALMDILTQRITLVHAKDGAYSHREHAARSVCATPHSCQTCAT